MHNRSLICFTLFTQSAVGLVWVWVAGRWFAGGTQAVFFTWPMVIALALTGIGLSAALPHLARPRLAPNALRNLSSSWLSREVLLVPAFAAAVVLNILWQSRGAPSGLVVLEAAACLLGAAALLAMTGVYLLKTVPVWNTPATPLEFVGSAMLLGGALGAMLASLETGAPASLHPVLMMAGTSVALGLMLKLAAVFPTVYAEKAATLQTWYPPAGISYSTRQVLALRMGLNLTGLVLMLFVMRGLGPARLWSCLCLICIGTAEVIGRAHFYKAHGRIGL